MRVKKIMTGSVKTCRPESTLSAATALMEEADCGVLPVVADSGGRVVGMITDRDIALALGSRNKPASEIQVEEVMSTDVFACSPTDDVHAALKTMRKQGVRRLPVVNNEKEIEGILSMDDIVLGAKEANGRKALSFGDAMKTFKSICKHPRVTESQKPSLRAAAS
jgi:CBS domain-containing protein